MNKPKPERVTFSPVEFAALFGKSQTWGYRQIYAGRVSTIKEFGRIMIPALEVEKILQTAGRYNGRKPTPAKTKAELEKLAPLLRSSWQQFIEQRRVPTEAKEAKEEGRKRTAWPCPKRAVDQHARGDAMKRLKRKG